MANKDEKLLGKKWIFYENLFCYGLPVSIWIASRVRRYAPDVTPVVCCDSQEEMQLTDLSWSQLMHTG